MSGLSMNLAGLAGGFDDPVHDSQRAFRAILDALSRPGRLARLVAPATPPTGVDRAAAGAVLTLADPDTPLWLDERAAAAADYFRFHCGCPRAACRRDATFALVHGADLRLADFAPGTPEEPERSATLVVMVESLAPEGAWRLRGPGIDGVARVEATGLPADFLAQWRNNAAGFPCGVDLLLTAGDLALGLPRTVRIEV